MSAGWLYWELVSILKLMNTIQALELLDKVAQNYNGNRADHLQLQQAVEVLRGLITDVANEKVAKKEKK